MAPVAIAVDEHVFISVLPNDAFERLGQIGANKLVRQIERYTLAARATLAQREFMGHGDIRETQI